MEEDNTLSADSTCMDVSNYFFKNFGITEEAKNKLIEECISGDILIDIPKQDFKNFGIKLNSLIKIDNFIRENKKKLTKEINENISSISTEENIKNFFERCLNFKGDLNHLKEEELLKLDEEKMKALGLKYGQRKKLIKYIKYFNSLKEEDIEITITEKSNNDEVKKFLITKLKLSPELVEYLDIDAESLFLLEEDVIDDLGEMKDKEKEMIKKFIKKKEKMKIIKITKESNKEDIIAFIKSKGKEVNNRLEIDLEKINNLILNEKEIIKSFIEREQPNNQEQLDIEKLNDIHNEISEEKSFKKLEEIKHSIEINMKYNYFFIFSFSKDYMNNIYLSCSSKDINLIHNLDFYLIYQKYDEINKEKIINIIKASSERTIKTLCITIKDEIEGE